MIEVDRLTAISDKMLSNDGYRYAEDRACRCPTARKVIDLFGGSTPRVKATGPGDGSYGDGAVAIAKADPRVSGNPVEQLWASVRAALQTQLPRYGM